MKKATKKDKRILRHRSMRAKIAGNAEKPRLAVFRSNKHLYVQLIDDEQGRVMAAASDRELPSKKKGIELAKEIGKLIARRMKERKIENIVFDRTGYTYHGQIKALAQEMRAQGIPF